MRVLDDGEAGKYQRYGDSVLPLVFETFGRLGKESMQTLERLVDAASMLWLCRGGMSAWGAPATVLAIFEIWFWRSVRPD